MVQVHPERQTSAYVAERLRAFGLEVHAGLAKTGVVGVLRGATAPDGAAHAIGLRADLDALHIHEQSEVAPASRHPGRMHACGHDGHTAILIGAAREGLALFQASDLGRLRGAARIPVRTRICRGDLRNSLRVCRVGRCKPQGRKNSKHDGCFQFHNSISSNSTLN